MPRRGASRYCIEFELAKHHNGTDRGQITVLSVSEYIGISDVPMIPLIRRKQEIILPDHDKIPSAGRWRLKITIQNEESGRIDRVKVKPALAQPDVTERRGTMCVATPQRWQSFPVFRHSSEEGSG